MENSKDSSTQECVNHSCNECNPDEGEFKYTTAMDVGDSLMLIVALLLLGLAIWM